jgi:hypothetical protein
MYSFLPQPAFMPCLECGASVARADAASHECEDERRVEYQLFQLRDAIGAFDDDLAGYLDSPAGRFETWYAAHERRTAS